MKLFRIIILTGFIVSCASIRVDYDYDTKSNFNSYKTYNYYSDLDTGLSILDNRRLLNALDSILQYKGLTLSETPNFYIDISSKTYQNTSRNTVGVGVGGTGRNVGGGISIGLGSAKNIRQIRIDFVDEKGSGLFWQALSESAFDLDGAPEKREAQLKSVIAKILERYPPKQ